MCQTRTKHVHKKPILTKHPAYAVNENFYLLFSAQIRTIFKKRKRRILAARARKSTHFHEFRAIFSCVLLEKSACAVIYSSHTKMRQQASKLNERCVENAPRSAEMNPKCCKTG